MKRLIARAVEKNRPALAVNKIKAAFAGQNIQSNPTYVRLTLYSYIPSPETGLLRMIMLQYISYLFETEL